MNIYNEIVKQEFLSKYPQDTQQTYKWIFKKSYELENELSKDLSFFNITDLANLMKQLKPISNGSAQSYGRIITSYVNWSNVSNSEILNLNNKWFYQFVDFSQKIYWSELEVFAMENKLVNAQDSVLIRLLFEGINGQGHSEILNITKRDINIKDKTIKLVDSNLNERVVEVSDRLLYLIDKAFKQTVYYNKNGEAVGKRTSQKLIKNEYLIRTSNVTAKHDKIADKFLIQRRISSIASYFNYKNLTANRIRNSGMLKMTKDSLFNQEISNDILLKVADRFKINTSTNYEKLKEIVNIKNINLLY